MSLCWSQATKSGVGGGGGEMLSGYPIKKRFFTMSIHAKCEFLNKSGRAREEGYFWEESTEVL